MRIAFFGGSFDPPHLGHLAIARAARDTLRLDQVLFAPVGYQPLKPDGPSASFEDRVAMLKLAITDEPAFGLSMADAPGETPNYTIDTLTRLKEELEPGTELFLLVGADALRTLSHWHRAADIPFAANLIVASRPDVGLENIPKLLPNGVRAVASSVRNQFLLSNTRGQESELIFLPDLHYEISATQIRDQIGELDVKSNPLLSALVLAYIREHHLYQ